MVYGLWLAADGLTTQQLRQDVIANNLANVDTPGFKPDRVAFAERMVEARRSGGLGARHPIFDSSTGGLAGLPTYTDFSNSAKGIVSTNNPLDVALRDGGFFSIQTDDGMRYTRDGRFVMDAQGVLRHGVSNGVVVNAAGQPIELDPTSREPVHIDESGRVMQGGDVLGQFAVVDFEDRQQLEKVGQNLYSADYARSFEVNASMKQAAYEMSGVEPSSMLVDMIEATRAYQMNATMITMQDQSLGRLVSEVGKIG